MNLPYMFSTMNLPYMFSNTLRVIYTLEKHSETNKVIYRGRLVPKSRRMIKWMDEKNACCQKFKKDNCGLDVWEVGEGAGAQLQGRSRHHLQQVQETKVG